MKIIEGETIEKAFKNLQFIARYKPYKYGGTWYAFRFNNVNYFYRNKSAVRVQLIIIVILSSSFEL